MLLWILGIVPSFLFMGDKYADSECKPVLDKIVTVRIKVSFEIKGDKKDYFCSGVIIDKDKVLTSYRDCLGRHIESCWTKQINCELKVIESRYSKQELRVNNSFVPGVQIDTNVQLAQVNSFKDGGVAILVVEEDFKRPGNLNGLKLYSQPTIDPSLKDTVYCALSSNYYEGTQDQAVRVAYRAALENQAKKLQKIETSIECGIKYFLYNAILSFNDKRFRKMEMCGLLPENYDMLAGDIGGAVVMIIRGEPYLLGVISSKQAYSSITFPFSLNNLPYVRFVPLYSYEFWMKSVFDKLSTVNRPTDFHMFSKPFTEKILTPPSSFFEYSKKQQMLQLNIKQQEADDDAILFIGTIDETKTYSSIQHIEDPDNVQMKNCVSKGSTLESLKCNLQSKYKDELKDLSSHDVVFEFLKTGRVEGMEYLTKKWIKDYNTKLKSKYNYELINQLRSNIDSRLLQICTTPVVSNSNKKIFYICFEINWSGGNTVLVYEKTILTESVFPSKRFLLETTQMEAEGSISTFERYKVIDSGEAADYAITLVPTTVLSSTTNWANIYGYRRTYDETNRILMSYTPATSEKEKEMTVPSSGLQINKQINARLVDCYNFENLL